MKWKQEPKPRRGDKRIVKRFALLPVLLDNKYNVWLEIYKVSQRYGFDGWRGCERWDDEEYFQ